MKISKKAEYAIRAVITIAHHKKQKPLQINEISKKNSIPLKFLEQILLNLKNNGILSSKRGINGGYLLAKSVNDISIGMILESIDGRFDPFGLNNNYDLGLGLNKCFVEMTEMINQHLNKYTIQEILRIEEARDSIAFEI